MKKIGIIGINDGNGHPYSFSAMFNGFNNDYLQKYCPFDLIKEYLPRDHRNEFIIQDSKVTHIWTQDRHQSELISKTCFIPNIVDDFTDLIGKVDAVILARDDIENHLNFILPFLKNKIPIFIDKQLVWSKRELETFKSNLSHDNLIMSASPMKYSRHLEDFKLKNNNLKIRTVHGISRVNWMRYAHHLLEAVVSIFGYEIEYVQSINTYKGHETILIKYYEGPSILLEFIKNISLPIQLNFFSENEEPKNLEFGDFFYGFYKMMKTFSEMINSGSQLISNEEIFKISKIVIAGQISIENNGEKINPKTLNNI